MKIAKKVNRVYSEENYYVVETNSVDIRVWFLTENIIRIRAGFDGDFDECSYSLVTCAWKSRTDELFQKERHFVTVAPSVLSEKEDAYLISGEKLTLRVAKEPFLIQIFDKEKHLLHSDIPDLAYREDSNHRRLHSAEIEAEDYFFGFGETSGGMNKAQEDLHLAPGDAMGYDPEKTDGLYKHIPFYIRLQKDTKIATGYFYHNSGECEFNLGRQKRNYWHRYSTYIADGGDIDYFFIAGPRISEVISGYTDLTGKSVMLPKAALGYLGSSMYYPELPKDCDDAILNFVDTAKNEGIPMDGFQLSSGYCAIPTEEGIKRCSFTWNYDRFKDPKKWFLEMEEKGVVVSPNVKPGMLLVHPKLSEMEEKKMFIRESLNDGSTDISDYDESAPGVGTWWGGQGYFTDFTRESTREHWKEYLKENLLKYGCRSIWNDNCEYDSVVDKDCRVYYEGKGSTIGQTKSFMSNLMCKLAKDAILEYDENRRPFVVCRSGHAGIQRYAQTWAGDNLTCWEALRFNICTMLGMGLSGVSNQGCDVGGFYGPAPEPELFVRWVQNGIFMPRFSIHSVNIDNTVTEPWMYEEVTPLIRDAISFRYQLSPYLYSLMYRAHKSGLPMMAPLFLQYQEDERTYDEDENFMLGESLLVANVVEKGADEKRVYFPKITIGKNDSWDLGLEPEKKQETIGFYDFYTREFYEGGKEENIPVSLESIPLFVPGGAILPMAENKINNLAQDEVTALRILFAPDRDSSFDFYEDDGKSMDYEKGDYRLTRISVERGDITKISFKSEGSYVSPVKKMHLDVIHRQKAPFFVRVAGKEIPQYLYKKDFEQCEIGWYYDMSLKSVQIKYPQIRSDYEVEISFEQFDMIGM